MGKRTNKKWKNYENEKQFARSAENLAIFKENYKIHNKMHEGNDKKIAKVDKI